MGRRRGLIIVLCAAGAILGLASMSFRCWPRDTSVRPLPTPGNEGAVSRVLGRFRRELREIENRRDLRGRQEESVDEEERALRLWAWVRLEHLARNTEDVGTREDVRGAQGEIRLDLGAVSLSEVVESSHFRKRMRSDGRLGQQLAAVIDAMLAERDTASESAISEAVEEQGRTARDVAERRRMLKRLKESMEALANPGDSGEVHEQSPVK